jgi:hypothetical protein
MWLELKRMIFHDVEAGSVAKMGRRSKLSAPDEDTAEMSLRAPSVPLGPLIGDYKYILPQS